MSRWKLTIEYDGRPFCGFQKQLDELTVQGVIERAIEKFCQKSISITVAGRTDASVHAKGQVAHFDLDYRDKDGKERSINGFELAKAINAYMLEYPVSIIDCQEVDDEFHARFSATNKLYTYRVINRPYGLALDQGLAWWFKRRLDIDKMREACEYFIGHHDFTTFRATECQAKSPVRTLDKFEIETRDILNGQEILFHIQGRSFLHHQVRNMVGTLTLVGEGKWQPEDIQAALEAKDRTKGGPTAPAEGLYLVRIDY